MQTTVRYGVKTVASAITTGRWTYWRDRKEWASNWPSCSTTDGPTQSYCLFQAEDGIRDIGVTGVQTCALPIFPQGRPRAGAGREPERRLRRQDGHLPHEPERQRLDGATPRRRELVERPPVARLRRRQIGRASCRERA